MPSGPRPAAGRLRRHTFPPDFPVTIDHSLGTPVLGFGRARARAARPGDLPARQQRHAVPTTCNGHLGMSRDLAQTFHDSGYALGRAVGPRLSGRPVDLDRRARRTARPSPPRARQRPRSARFRPGRPRATPARAAGGHRRPQPRHHPGPRVDRQDAAQIAFARFVNVDGPSHGIINCSPSSENYYVSRPRVRTLTAPSASSTAPTTRRSSSRANAGDETPGRPSTCRWSTPTRASCTSRAGRDLRARPRPRIAKGKPHDFSRSAPPRRRAQTSS